MSNALYTVISENRASLEDEVFLRLNASSVLNKQDQDEERLRGRVGRLVDNFLASLENTSEVFVAYVESITAEHIEEGLLLHELQLALIVLEEKVWQFVVEAIPLKDQVRSLGLVNLIIGTAKDRVAHIFLHHLEMVESEVTFLRRRSGFLAQGTKPAPGMEDDVNWQRGSVKPPHEMI